jgi:hypothetical protein
MHIKIGFYTQVCMKDESVLFYQVNSNKRLSESERSLH